MIKRDELTDFQKFQELLKDVGCDNIPQNEYECDYKVDSYDLFQMRIKGHFRLSPEEMTLLSKYIPIEKYYWSSAMMFPSSYLSFYDGNDFKDIYDLNEEEQTIFNEQITQMVKDVYLNQKALGYSLDSDYMEIGSRIVQNLGDIYNHTKQNKNEGEKNER